MPVSRQEYVATVDLGGTQFRTALVDAEGRILAAHREPTQAADGPEEVTRRMISTIQRLVRGAGAPGPRALGVAVASPVGADDGVMNNPPNLPGWHGYSLKSPLEEAFRVPVYIGNDASLAALGEHTYGAGIALNHLVYLTISTGIGGGVIAEGRLLTGAKGLAAELGHIKVDFRSSTLCACGRTGCLESLASGTAIARVAQERLAAGEASVLRERFPGDLERITAKDVGQAAREGDPLAQEVFTGAAEALGAGIVSLIHVFDPQAVLLGGGVVRGEYDLLQPALSRWVDANVMAHYRGQDLVRKAALGDDMGLLGAAALAWRALG